MPIGAVQRTDPWPVGADGRHRGAVAGVRARVDKRLKVSSLARYEHDETSGHAATLDDAMARPTNPAPEIQQRAWAALMLSVLSLLGITLIGNLSRAVYVLAMTFVFALVALWLAVTAISRARRGGAGRPRGAIAGVVLGVLALGFSGLMLIAFAVLGPQLTQYGKCLTGANTDSARTACQNQFSNAVNVVLSGMDR